MKEYQAKLCYLRRTPRRVNDVARLIRGKPVQEAVNILSFCVRGSAKPLKKLILSALANGGHGGSDVPPNVFVKELRVNQGPVMKRWMPRAQGRVSPLRKRTSHVLLTLKEKIF